MLRYQYDATKGSLSLSRTQSSNSLRGAWPHVNAAVWREEKGRQANQGNALSSDVGNLRADKTYWGRAHMRPPGTGSRPVWMGWDPHSPQTLHLGHTATVSRVTPQTLHLGHTATVSRVTPPDPAPGLTHRQSPGWPPRSCSSVT